MNHSLNFFGLSASQLLWIGGALSLVGTMLLLLLVHNYRFNVVSADAALSSAADFWTDDTIIGAIASAILLASGLIVLVFGLGCRFLPGRDCHTQEYADALRKTLMASDKNRVRTHGKRRTSTRIPKLND